MFRATALLSCAIVLFFASFAVPVQAQSQEARVDTILVFDASGSMWGQIDGVNKIVIARDVVSELLRDLPASHRLGLIAYGHNRKGDCSDIEMLAPVGSDHDAIADLVQRINPKGMTPMTDAVILAAEELKYTENQATVILVSDGEETCHADPCAAARHLADLGVGLTVHTVGFGLESAEAQAATAQLQCMAEATGGQFFTAANAEELGEALATVAEAIPQPVVPASMEVRFQATDQEGGPVIDEGLVWTVRDAVSEEVLHESEETGVWRQTIGMGIKNVSVRRLSDGAEAHGRFDPWEQVDVTLAIVVEHEASLEAPATAAASEYILVSWAGPDKENDYISVDEPDVKSGHYTFINYTRVREGSPLKLKMPPDAGTYEIRYVLDNGKRVLARHTIEVVATEATLEAPATAHASEGILVVWTGPDNDNDYISVDEPDVESGSYTFINYTRTRNGSPLELQMPPDAGTYEIRYVQDQGKRVLARHTIEVLATESTLDAPATAHASEVILIGWTGPDNDNDYISVDEPDVESGSYTFINYTRTRDGSPLKLQMPPDAGTYEIRYVQDQGKRVLARHTIEVSATTAQIDAPATARASETIEFSWTGPDNENDYISVDDPDVETGSYSFINYTRTRTGSPLKLQMPPDAGTYEIRYVQDQGKRVLARHTIEIQPVTASLSIPARAQAGEAVVVEWTGPDNHNDYISVDEPDVETGSYTFINYTRTRNGSPLELTMPEKPGTYEIRYVQDQGKRVLARKSITVYAGENE